MSDKSLFLLKLLISKFNIKWVGDLNKYMLLDHGGWWFSDTTQKSIFYYTKEEFNEALDQIKAEDADKVLNWYDYKTKQHNFPPPLTIPIYFTNLGIVPEEKHAAQIMANVIAYDYNGALIVLTGDGKIYRLGSNISIAPLDYKEPDVAVVYINSIGINYDAATRPEREHLIRLYMAGALKGQ